MELTLYQCLVVRGVSLEILFDSQVNTAPVRRGLTKIDVSLGSDSVSLLKPMELAHDFEITQYLCRFQHGEREEHLRAEFNRILEAKENDLTDALKIKAEVGHSVFCDPSQIPF